MRYARRCARTASGWSIKIARVSAAHTGAALPYRATTLDDASSERRRRKPGPSVTSDLRSNDSVAGHEIASSGKTFLWLRFDREESSGLWVRKEQ